MQELMGMEIEEERYQIIDNHIVDTRKQELLLLKETVVNRLNRQDRLIRIKDKRISAMIDALNKEMDEADGEELRRALIRISNVELEL